MLVVCVNGCFYRAMQQQQAAGFVILQTKFIDKHTCPPVNKLCIDATDPISAEPDFKKSAVRVTKA